MFNPLIPSRNWGCCLLWILYPGKDEDAQGSRGGSGTAGTALWGPHNGLFKGLSQRETWRMTATLSVVTQEPQVPSPATGTGSRQAQSPPMCPADAPCIILQPHPGKAAALLFLRAPIKPPCLKFLLVLLHSLPGSR